MSDLLSPGELARDEMAANGVDDPTLAALVVALRHTPNGPARTQAERWYWALAADKHGSVRARWHREELEWLRTHR